MNADDTGAEKAVNWPEVLAGLNFLERHHHGAKPDHDPAGYRGLTGSAKPTLVAVIGVDGLERVRDEFGSRALEDGLLRTISKCVPGARAGRMNRSRIEFSFSARTDEAPSLLRDLHETLEQGFLLNKVPVRLHVAIGFAGRGSDDIDLEVLVERAEHALAKARSLHTGVECYSEADQLRRTERLELMRNLRSALGKDELFVCYQPKLDLRTLAITGAEALVRWRHPTKGLVSPDDFITFAEEGDEIRPLTEFVVAEAIHRHYGLLAKGLAYKIAVNVSARLLEDDRFAHWAVDAVGAAAPGISFEITETAVIAYPERALACIRMFNAAGIGVSIDDYGAGLSSLSYLKQIAADELKIDKSFVTNLTTSNRDPLLVRSTIDLGHALGMKVTAEGVDNARAFALLQVMGCDMIQGYLLSKPLEFDQLMNFIAEFDAAFLKPKPMFDTYRHFA